MRIALYEGKGKIKLTNLEMPVAGDNDIVIKNIYASICGTDVAVYTKGPGLGHKINVGGEFGHEMVSEVVQVGKNISNIKIGDRVYPYPLLAKGDSKRAGTVGGFSEYVLVPNAELNKVVYAVSDKIESKVASLIEPFTVGCRAARRSRPKCGENAVVYGAGTIGIASAIALKYFGCSKVMICDRSSFRLKIAKDLGFAVCNNKDENLLKVAKEYFGEAACLSGRTANIDIFIDAAGAPQILSEWQQIGKIGCRMVVVAVISGMRPVDILHMTYAQQELIGSGGYMPEDVRDVMAIMESNKWDIQSIITHEFPWEKLPEAIEKAANVNSSLNVVIKY